MGTVPIVIGSFSLQLESPIYMENMKNKRLFTVGIIQDGKLTKVPTVRAQRSGILYFQFFVRVVNGEVT